MKEKEKPRVMHKQTNGHPGIKQGLPWEDCLQIFIVEHPTSWLGISLWFYLCALPISALPQHFYFSAQPRDAINQQENNALWEKGTWCFQRPCKLVISCGALISPGRVGTVHECFSQQGNKVLSCAVVTAGCTMRESLKNHLTRGQVILPVSTLSQL